MNCTETDVEDILAPKSKRRKEIGKDDTACIGQHVYNFSKFHTACRNFALGKGVWKTTP